MLATPHHLTLEPGHYPQFAPTVETLFFNQNEETWKDKLNMITGEFKEFVLANRARIHVTSAYDAALTPMLVDAMRLGLPEDVETTAEWPVGRLNQFPAISNWIRAALKCFHDPETDLDWTWTFFTVQPIRPFETRLTADLVDLSWRNDPYYVPIRSEQPLQSSADCWIHFPANSEGEMTASYAHASYRVC